MNKYLLSPLVALVALAACAEGPTTPTPETRPDMANVKLKGGPNAEPSFTDNGLTLSSLLSITGLGNGDVFISLIAQGNATATCTNPGTGGVQPPGQNPAPVTVQGGQLLDQEEIKNGNLTATVTTAVPAGAGPRPSTGECPNSQWTYTVTDIAFTSAIIEVEQPQGSLVLRVSCTFSQPTSNGAVPGGNVNCTQTQF